MTSWHEWYHPFILGMICRFSSGVEMPEVQFCADKTYSDTMGGQDEFEPDGAERQINLTSLSERGHSQLHFDPVQGVRKTQRCPRVASRARDHGNRRVVMDHGAHRLKSSAQVTIFA